MRLRLWFCLCFGLCSAAVLQAADAKSQASSSGAHYLFVWAGDAAHKSTDFLSVIDANPSSASYGSVVRTLPVDSVGGMPHHTEYEFPATNKLFANAWVAGRTFVFDLHDPLKPRVAGQLKDRAGYFFPHSFARLPNSHVLATFQSHSPGYASGGGLVELDEGGEVVRSSSAVDSSVSSDFIWPYSLVPVLALDRIVSSSTAMGWPDWKELPPGSWTLDKMNDLNTSHVQIWRLSDLRLLHTIVLPPDSGKHNENPAEPRLLPDGTVYVNTFRCGLFRIKNLNSAAPSAELVHAFPGGDNMHTMCAVPVVVGHYWIQTVGTLPGLIVLDISHPDKPVEVSRFVLSPRFPMPHWLAADRKGNRIVMTGDEGSWVAVAVFDTHKGTLTLDPKFHDPGAKEPGVSFDRQEWPHGKTGPAIVHGAVFGPQ